MRLLVVGNGRMGRLVVEHAPAAMERLHRRFFEGATSPREARVTA